MTGATANPLLRFTQLRRQAVLGVPQRWGAPAATVLLVALFAVPSLSVLKPVGAMGFPAGLVGLGLLVVWLAMVGGGLHRASRFSTPVRGVLVAWTVTNLVVYAAAQRLHPAPETVLAADRWMMLNAMCAGVILVVSEGADAPPAMRRVAAVLCWGAAFSTLVAVADLAGLPVVRWLASALPGFSVNQEFATGVVRQGLVRGTGTAIHPIEFGAVACMVLPLAMARVLRSSGRARLAAGVAAGLVALAVPLSVSRSALLGVTVAAVVFIPLHAPRVRTRLLAGAVVVGLAVAAALPGLLGRFGTLILGSGSDSSIRARLIDYPMVEARFAQHPLLGTGGGTYLQTSTWDILDNQYLKSLLELGLVGMAGQAAFMLLPVVFALRVRRRTTDPDLREYGAALAAGMAASVVLCATFDAFAFPMYVLTYAVLCGLLGACWVAAGRAAAPDTSLQPTPTG